MTSNKPQQPSITRNDKEIRMSAQHLEREQNINSASTLKTGPFSRERVPVMLQSTLREKNRLSRPNSPNRSEAEKNQSLKESLKRKMKGTVDHMKKVTICQICEGQMVQRNNRENKKIYISQCLHKYMFCESCLHHYVIYKVNNYQEVCCPMDSCPDKMQMTSGFFKSLPVDIQNKYKKIYHFQLITNDPNVKLCPKKDCEGVIRTTGSAMQESMICDTCQRKFCGRCLLTYHDGDCGKQQLKHYQRNLSYRKCQMCKHVVEKPPGSNQMKCICGYNFCYTCSSKWQPSHWKCQGSATSTETEEKEKAPYCLPCLCCLSESCLTPMDCCCCGTLLKYFFKLIMLILYIALMLPIFIFGCLPFAIVMVGVSIIHGILCYPYFFLTTYEGNGALCMTIVFFPFIIFMGIYQAIQRFVCQKAADVWKSYWLMLKTGVELIGKI